MDESVIRGSWSRSRVEAFLSEFEAPIRLAVLGDSGFPLVCSLWFLFDEGRLLCATTSEAKIVEQLRADPKCGFELAPNEPPYYGVRGQGVASISSEGANALLERLVARYLGDTKSRFARWLLNREVDEVVIEIEVQWLTSWDFRGRMSA